MGSEQSGIVYIHHFKSLEFIPNAARNACRSLPYRVGRGGIPVAGPSLIASNLEGGPVLADWKYLHVYESHMATGDVISRVAAAEILRGARSPNWSRFRACGMIEKRERDTMWMTGDFRRGTSDHLVHTASV